MINKLQYSIEFLSEWHTGSGLDAGTSANALVAKTDEGLPYIPGKTIKGLLRDACNDMVDAGRFSSDTLIEIFGGKKNKNDKEEEKEEEENVTQSGNSYFSNAYLGDDDKTELIDHQLQSYLYRTIASTKINEAGTAQHGSLRSIEVCVPVILTGTISITNTADVQHLIDAAKLVRHLGVQRNRGLGRCRIKITKN